MLKLSASRARTAVLLLVFSAIALTASAQSFPLKLSSNGSYLVDQNNRPFFINGDSGWELIAQLSKTDADTYLENRRQKGYNLILVELLAHKYATNAPANYYGDQPFTSPGNFSTPNETYFAHADWVINDAASKGQMVLLAPLFLGYQCGDQGWCAEVMASDSSTIRNYGRYIGNRYKNFSNIIWMVGGDVDAVAAGVSDKLQELIAGLKETDPGHLMTVHNARGQAGAALWPGASWLDLDSVYADSLTYVQALAEFNRTPVKPIFLVESYYENDVHQASAVTLRAQAYWTVLSGGVQGHIFGNHPLWSLGAPQAAPQMSWQSAMETTGSVSVALVGKLFNSRAFYDLVPDQYHQILTAGYQSGLTYAAAARTSDGATVIAYIPMQRAITIDLTKVSGASAQGWWFNTRNGAASSIGTFSTTGAHSFTPPDGNDWVLVLDDASKGLPAPGTTGSGASQRPAAPTNLRILP